MLAPAPGLLGDETVHLAAVDVSDRALGAMRSAAIAILCVVEWLHASALRVRYAHGKRAVARAGQPITARVGAEIAVVRTVLLHDDDDVLDLVDVARHRRGPRL